MAPELERNPDPKDCFPWDLVKKGAPLGFFTMRIPKEYGGLGIKEIDYAIILEELGWGDAGYGTIVGAHWLAPDTIIELGTEEQKRRWLPKVVEGQKNPPYLTASAGTEHGVVGDLAPRTYKKAPLKRITVSEYLGNYTVPAAQRREVTTTARLDGDEYVINGTKRFISNGSVASLYTVRATIDPSQPDLCNTRAFVLLADTPGVSFGTIEDKMGHRLSIQSEVFFDNVLVPKEDMLPPGPVFGGSGTAGEMGLMVGIARAAYEAALEYATVRYKNGNRIIFHQAVGMMLADMDIMIQTARLLL